MVSLCMALITFSNWWNIYYDNKDTRRMKISILIHHSQVAFHGLQMIAVTTISSLREIIANIAAFAHYIRHDND